MFGVSIYIEKKQKDDRCSQNAWQISVFIRRCFVMQFINAVASFLLHLLFISANIQFIQWSFDQNAQSFSLCSVVSTENSIFIIPNRDQDKS